MQIYLAIKYYPDTSNRVLIEMIYRAVEASGFRCFCIAREVERWGKVQLDAHELMRHTFAVLSTSNAVLVEVSEKGVGIGIEAGFAAAKEIPVIAIARTGIQFPNTLMGIAGKSFNYRAEFDLAEQLKELVSNGRLSSIPRPLVSSLQP
ncbi:hypothetical protein [Bradyrhizobium sp. HKCCYLRH1030]|uniref:hypothetical protein n=1 Tax=Bradyrhizobium sp. HKCCYLRH1030 TaxID=3420744 RepID=UPI003EBEA55C